MKIKKLLNALEELDVVVPEFQREFVWNLDQSKELMQSLFKDYPTGSILVWDTNNPPEIKNDAVNKERIGWIKVLLDGQQRLTTLYLLIKGKIPPYYIENDITHDPRHLYFNLKAAEFSYYQKQKMDGNPFWKSIVSCFNDDFDAFILVEKLDIENAQEKLKLGSIINSNLNRLRGIANIDYHVQSIPQEANIDNAIDIFDKVNSMGTKLTDAELVLTHITGKWPQARRLMKEKIENYKKVYFDFNLDFLTRCMVVILMKSALFEKMTTEVYQKATEDEYREAWRKLVKTLDYLIPILKQTGYIEGSDDLSTNNILTPIVAYLSRNGGSFSGRDRNKFIYWMFLASIWRRYSGQTDQKLDKDVYFAINSDTPVEDLIKEIEDERGRIEIKPTDLEGRMAGHPLYKMLHIITRYNKAIDWSNGASLQESLSEDYSIQSHHIFPQSLLYKNGYDSQNILDKKIVNEVANRAFITRDTNYTLADRSPVDYLKDVKREYPKALKQQLIPENENLWLVKNYKDFLSARRRLIVDGITKFLKSFKEEAVERKINYKEMIRKGESNYVEFKASLRWDYGKKMVNKKLEHSVVKTLSAFMNVEGGKLFIGVSDDGEIISLGEDYKTLSKKNKDGFLIQLDQIINSYLGKEFHQYISAQIIELEGKEICVVDVGNSDREVYVKFEGKEEFYIRASASSQPMSMKEANDYIKTHWD